MSEFARNILKAMEEMKAPPINYSTYIPFSMPPELIDIYLKRDNEGREKMFHEWLKILAEE